MASSIGVLAWAIGVIFPKVGAVQIILIAAMTAVVLSAYHIWAQERAKLVVAVGRLAQAEETGAVDVSGRDEFLVLTGRLSQFLNARRADYDDSQPSDPLEIVIEQMSDREEDAIGFPGRRARKRAAIKRSHDNVTLREYGDRFAKHVIAAGRRLHDLGVSDAETVHIRRFPRTVADIEAAIRELEAASASLPAAPISDVMALRNTIAAQNAKIAALEPRHLSSDVRRTIAEHLQPLRDGWVKRDPAQRIAEVGVYYMPGTDCAQYAQDFCDLFQSIGFQTLGDGHPIPFSLQGQITITDGFESGIVVMDYSPETRLAHWRPDFGDALLAAMAEAGIESRKSDIDGPVFGIVIGAKP